MRDIKTKIIFVVLLVLGLVFVPFLFKLLQVREIIDRIKILLLVLAIYIVSATYLLTDKERG